MNETDLAYMAGFFDGEGCVTLRYQVLKDGRNCFRRRVCVVNTNQDILKTFQSCFGGYFKERVHMKRYKGCENHKHIFEWTDTETTADVFIEKIIPYLRLKKRQAELYLEYQKTMLKTTGANFQGGLHKSHP
jgi:hypothetical protein